MDIEKYAQKPSQAVIFLDRQSDLQWDDLAIKVIPLKDRLEEPNLYATKWWDYRPLSPAHATALFAHAYGMAWRASHFRRNGDVPLIGTPFRTDHWNPYAEAPVRAKAFWKARRICDEIGIPYPFYCFTFFGIAESYFEDLPRPQEMWRKDVIGFVMDHWAELGNSGHLIMPEHELFHLRYNWQDKKYQHEFEDMYVSWLKVRPSVIRDFHLEQNERFFRDETVSAIGA